ncbi:MAG: hypothetical protein ABIJ39_14455 [Chloroflexota bacterium]
MNPLSTENLSNIDIAVYALYLLGGWRDRVHTEDIALKCFELAPSKFSWVKYPEYPDNHTAYLSLGDAKKQKYGALVEGGSERQKGKKHIGRWKLTPHGVEWIEISKQRIEEALGKHATIGERLDTDRKLKELRNSTGYRKFLRDGDQADISHAEFAESLVCTVNTSPEILNDRLEQLLSIAEKKKQDEIKRYVGFCQEKFVNILK